MCSILPRGALTPFSRPFPYSATRARINAKGKPLYMDPRILDDEQVGEPKRWYPLTTMPSSQDNKCVCNNRDHIDFDKHHFEHTQQKEEFIIAYYSKILDSLQKQYIDISTRISTEIQGGFEEGVLEGVLDHLRDMMGNNEYCVAEARRKLWTKFNAEEGIEVRSKE